MTSAGVRRISVISAAGVGDSRAVLNWPMRFLLATSNVGTAQELEAEQFTERTPITDGPRRT